MIPVQLFNFTNHLAENVRLPEGELWEVSLIALQCPEHVLTFANDGNQRDVTFVHKNNKETGATIPNGFYADISALVDAINTLTPGGAKPLKYDSFTKSVAFTLPPTLKELKLSSYVRKLLCLDLQTTIKEASLTSHRNAVYVYCNLIRPQFVGEAKAQLLNIVALNSITKGSLNSVSPAFVQLSDNSFDKIVIELTDSSGGVIPFSVGITTARLRFRKRS